MRWCLYDLEPRKAYCNDLTEILHKFGYMQIPRSPIADVCMTSLAKSF